MIIDCIADLHGYYPKLDGGDLLIVAGDLTARHTIPELDRFNNWVREQDYKKKILIAGNHDTLFERGVFDPTNPVDGTVLVDPSVDYLCDSGTEFEELKIWGSPWTKTFPGMNPHCKAFTCDTEEELAEKWALIPDDVDILITHSPPYGIFDAVRESINDIPISVGCASLRQKVMEIQPKIHVFGHIHEYGGKHNFYQYVHFINASYVNEHYQPVNKPIRVVLWKKKWINS